MTLRVSSFAALTGALTLLIGGALFSSIAPFSVPQVQAQTNSVQRDVTYCTAGGVALKMDIFPHKAPSGTLAPVAMYVHGGGWRTGDKASVGGVVRVDDLLSRGFLVAAINYRLAPENKWPAMIEDSKCAVRYLRANATRLGIDPARIGVWGGSAGGHLVAMLGLTGSEAGFEGNGGHAEQSSAVQAVVDMFGPTDLLAYDMSENKRYDPVFGALGQSLTETLRAASPINYVRGNAPPFLLVHGEKDELVPPSQSQALYDKLKGAGADATLVLVKNAAHVFAPSGGPISPTREEINTLIVDFLTRHVGSQPVQAGTPQATALPSSTAVPFPQGDARLFPETGKTVRGPFLQYWNARGGLAQQGYPISDEMRERSDTDGKSYTVQYFERAVFEYHPENGGQNRVLLSLLGTFRYKEKYPSGATSQTANTTDGSVLFPETGKRVGGLFLDYWRKNGGLAQQGYPISDEFTERSDTDGKEYRVQYFERAIMEMHPENQAPYNVLLSHLGAMRYRVKYEAGER